jgi:hypothetical protein
VAPIIKAGKKRQPNETKKRVIYNIADPEMRGARLENRLETG